jgi:hypothetical protein
LLVKERKTNSQMLGQTLVPVAHKVLAHVSDPQESFPNAVCIAQVIPCMLSNRACSR